MVPPGGQLGHLSPRGCRGAALHRHQRLSASRKRHPVVSRAPAPPLPAIHPGYRHLLQLALAPGALAGQPAALALQGAGAELARPGGHGKPPPAVGLRDGENRQQDHVPGLHSPHQRPPQPVHRPAADLPQPGHGQHRGGAPERAPRALPARPSVSVVVPARNEAGNIENAIRRLPAWVRTTK